MTLLERSTWTAAIRSDLPRVPKGWLPSILTAHHSEGLNVDCIQADAPGSWG